MLCINYIIICSNNNNNAVINNHVEDFKILLCFIIAMGMRKGSFKIYRQKTFVSPGLKDSDFLFEHCFFH